MACTGLVYLPSEEVFHGWRVESSSSTRGDRMKYDVVGRHNDVYATKHIGSDEDKGKGRTWERYDIWCDISGQHRLSIPHNFRLSTILSN